METITNIELFTVAYPVHGRFKFFENPAGRPFGRATVLVKITTSSGRFGWGQCVPSHRWSYETLESVETTLRLYLTPVLMGEDAADVQRLRVLMNQAIAPSFSTGQPICKAGVDLALFDLHGRRQSQTVAQSLLPAGQKGAGQTPISWTLNPHSLEDVEKEVQTAFDRGYQHFNIKVAPDVKFDAELCRLVRKLAPSAVIWVDANGGYEVEAALQAAPQLADLGVIALEQPVAANRLSALSRIRRQGALPVILDEPLVSLVDLREFHQLGLLDGAAVKVARCGGLSEAARQVAYLLENDLMFLGSGLTDPDLSLAASAGLFAAFKIEYPAALNGPQFLADSVLRTPLTVEEGIIQAPKGFGLGVEIDEEKLHQMCDAYWSAVCHI